MKENKIYRLIATVFGLGYAPLAPGTVGSLAGLVLCMLFSKCLVLYVLAFIVFFGVGVVSSDKVSKETGIKDPSIVVIDEFACIFVAFLLVPLNAATVITGFIVYRIIDIIKIYLLSVNNSCII